MEHSSEVLKRLLVSINSVTQINLEEEKNIKYKIKKKNQGKYLRNCFMPKKCYPISYAIL